jgi:oligopeptide/dipeptide ABC transporter ATP-binding protein
LLITHDLGVASQICDRVLVMYAGEIVEEGLVQNVFGQSRHPYTRGLLNSLPQVSDDFQTRTLTPIPGVVPPLGAKSAGCPYANRCELAQPRCREQSPTLSGAQGGHRYACHFPLAESAKGPQHG